MQAGTNPKVMAREIRQSIGLTAYLEIIEGVLYTMTKPRARHRRTGTGSSGDLCRPFDLGSPEGWRRLMMRRD